MANWQLDVGWGVKTFAEWGLTQPVISYSSQDADVARFTYVGVWEKADELFSYGERIRILRDGVQWFVGTVISTPLMAEARSERIEFTVKGPWLYFEEHVFQQPWASWNGLVAVNIDCSHLIFNAGTGGILISTRTQITTVLDFLLAQYANDPPFQYDVANILPGEELFAPWHEDRDLSCAQVLQQELRWHRNAVVWFDYETSPPSLHIRLRPQLAAVEVAMPSGTGPRAVRGKVLGAMFAPRHDLVRPSVVIRYESRNTVNGTSKGQLIVDNWPLTATGKEFGAWDASVDLLGFTKTTIKGSLVCSQKNYTNANWWRNHEPKLNSGQIVNLEISDIKVFTPSQFLTGSAPLTEVADPAAYPQELVEGQIAPWMEMEDGTPLAWRHEKITAKAKFQYYSQPGGAGTPIKLSEYDSMEVSVSLIATTAPQGETSYETTESFEGGDPQPIGLAKFLYEAVSVLEYSGSLTLKEEEVSGVVGMGNVLNVTGGRPEWAGMNALVQSVTEDIENGETRIEVGPPEQLGPQDLVELLKVGRRRMRWTNPLLIEEGDASFEELALGKAMPNSDSGMGPSQRSYVALTPDKQPDANGNVTAITLDAKNGKREMRQAAQGATVYIKEEMYGAGTPESKPAYIISAGPAGGSIELNLNDILDSMGVPTGEPRKIKLRLVCVKVGTAEKKALCLMGEPF